MGLDPSRMVEGRKVTNIFAFTLHILRSYPWVHHEEVLDQAIIESMERHGEDWDDVDKFSNAVVNVVNKNRYYLRRGRDTLLSVSADHWWEENRDGLPLSDIIPSKSLDPEKAYTIKEDLDNLLRMAEKDNRIALRVKEAQGYTTEELAELTGLSSHHIRLRLAATAISPSGAEDICVSCRQPRQVNEEFLCSNCRVDQEFTALPTRKASRGGNFSKRPWLNTRKV